MEKTVVRGVVDPAFDGDRVIWSFMLVDVKETDISRYYLRGKYSS